MGRRRRNRCRKEKREALKAMMPAFMPVDVSTLDMELGTNVDKLLPETCPDVFWKSSNILNEFAERLFFYGGKIHWECKEFIDRKKAIRHIRNILTSFEPSHEHKIAICAYLFYLWFDTGMEF